MLNEAQIKRVWERLLGSEIRANYFAELVSRCNRHQRILTWAILFLSSGAVAVVLVQLPPEMSFLRVLLPVGTAAVSLYSLVRQNQKLAMDAADLHLRWGKLALDYERLWENVYADDALTNLDALSDRLLEVSKASTPFPNEPEIMLKWENYVISHRLQPQAR